MTADRFLLAAAVITAWALVCVIRPSGRCLRCWGRRILVSKPHKARGRRLPEVRPPRACWLCGGDGWAPTPGAAIVWAFLKTVAGDRILSRRRDELTARLQSRQQDRTRRPAREDSHTDA